MYNKTEESIWTNQLLLYHRDNQFRSDAILELSISSSTKDYYSFNSMNTMISITIDKVRRACSLNYSNLLDLLSSLKKVATDPAAYNGSSIMKRYHQDRYISFEFKTTNESDQVVIISIFYNETDFGKVIISRQVFSAFANLLKKIEDKYIDYTFSLKSDLRQYKLILNTEEISRNIKVLPSNINISNTGISPTFKNTEPDVPETIFENTKMGELDKFVGGKEMSNITIPEIEIASKELKEQIETKVSQDTLVEYKSAFIESVLNMDCTRLDGLFSSVVTTSNPLFKFPELISKYIINKNDSYTDLPGISDKDLKSAIYLSKLLFTTHLQNYARNGVSIPGSVIPMMYKPAEGTEITQEHLDFAYDLLMISIYIRRMRNKLEVINNDCKSNKSILYLAFRCFSDIYSLSFLNDKNKDMIKTIIVSRFNHFKKAGFFDNYDKYLESYNCNQITVEEFTYTLDECLGKVFGKNEYISDIHNNLFKKGSIILPTDNKLKIEQITNELVPLEVGKKLNYEVNLKEPASKIVTNYIEGMVKAPVEKKEHESNLIRYSKRFIDEIPDGLRNDFLEYCKAVAFGEFSYDKYDLKLFGDNIVKGIYEWNESTNKNEKFTDFYLKCENSIMTKDLVLNKINASKIIPSKNEASVESIESIVLDLD